MPDPGAVTSLPVVGAFGRDVEDDLPYAAQSRVPVLVTGARSAASQIAVWLHWQTFRAGAAFIEIECTGTDFDVARRIESLVYGPPRRATIVLHDVDALSTRLQHIIGDLFGRREWRIISSTSADIYSLCLQHAFDEQTFYRLNAIHINAS